MQFRAHPALDGTHALLSPSNPSWLNYTTDKMADRFYTLRMAALGVALHALAHDAIKLGIRLERDSDKTLEQYVADGIAYKMKVEQLLYYSPNCYGTADTISFWNNTLRIHDLKTGINKTTEYQLFVYVALFCLEYQFSPFEITIECRIYQHGSYVVYSPHPDEIVHIMSHIILMDQTINELREELP